MPLLKAEDYPEYLRSTSNLLNLDPAKEYQLKELTGGTANFVFRVTHPDQSTTIIKHAEPFVRNNPSLRFPVDRMGFEARALREVSTLMQSTDAENTVEPAQYIGYDPNQHVLHMSDGGDTHLKDAYISDPTLDVPNVGRHLGAWLGRLHRCTANTDIGDNRTAKFIYRHSYTHLAGALEKHGHDPRLGRGINDEFGPLLQTDDGCVCHGDFWPGNVLVKQDPLKCTVVDWEMTRRGNGATDVGQFAAESWLLDRFHGKKGLREAFLKAYVAERGRGWSVEDARRVAVHFGTHLAFWPTEVQWGNTEECVQVGKEYLERARESDWDWLKKSELSVLFENAQ